MLFRSPLWIALNQDGPYSHYLRAREVYKHNRDTDVQPDWPQTNADVGDAHRNGSRMSNSVPVIFPRGTVCDKDGKIVHENNGHLGRLDRPNQVANINGLQHPHPEDNLLSA